MPLLCQHTDKRYRKEPRTFSKLVPPKVDIIGQKFGKLTVIDWAGNWNQRNFWACECECRNPDYNPVVTQTRCLRSGNTTSCGCTKRKHNMSKTPIYNVWQMMIKRCSDPHSQSYCNYGGRCITVCDRWKDSFGVFEELEQKPTLRAGITPYALNLTTIEDNYWLEGQVMEYSKGKLFRILD